MYKLSSQSKSQIKLGEVLFQSNEDTRRICKELAIYRTFYCGNTPDKVYLTVESNSYNKFLKIWAECEFPAFKLKHIIDEGFVTIIVPVKGLFAAPAWLDILFTCLKIASLKGDFNFLDGLDKLRRGNYKWRDGVSVYTKILESTTKSISGIKMDGDTCGIIYAMTQGIEQNLVKRKIQRKILKNGN